MIDIETMNPPQKEAVITTEGPVLVLAGAGSGKTRVLTYRIAYILDTGLAGSNNILAMTFTNKAAGEMKERINHLLKETNSEKFDGVYLNWMGTFHSICVKILKIDGVNIGLDKNFTIYDSSDQKEAVKEAMRRLNLSIKDFNPGAIHSYISSAKNELIDPETYAMYAQGYFQQNVADIYPVYQSILKENNALDFDDLLMYTVKLFNQNPKVLEKYQNQFKYILVDEYQDTNHAQYVIVKALASVNRNICCVGDDDQSIYAFRGATIKNILNFEKDYPECKVIKLEQNYRSTKKILEASYQVISKNRSRKDKKLWTENSDGENITLFSALDEQSEGRWITDRIKELSDNESLNEFAVLYRTNAQSRSLEESFINASIPYKIVGGLRFYDRKEIKDILSYLRCIYNPKDTQSIKRIINVPKRGIGNKTIEKYINEATSNNVSLLEFLNSTNIDNSSVRIFNDLINKFITKSKELNIVELINYILEHSGYIKMLEDGTLENESRIENLKELITVASKFSNLDPLDSLESFLEEVSLLEGIANENEEVKDSVTLMTIHAAKGLEFKYVFVSGVEENLFPHSNSMQSDSEMEEERRLAYVALTRAKDRLFLSHALKRRYFGTVQSNQLSRFINDVDSSLIDNLSDMVTHTDFLEDEDDRGFKDTQYIQLNTGDNVKHEYFGRGRVIQLDGSLVIVDFGSIHGVKELMLEYARLEKI